MAKSNMVVVVASFFGEVIEESYLYPEPNVPLDIGNESWFQGEEKKTHFARLTLNADNRIGVTTSGGESKSLALDDHLHFSEGPLSIELHYTKPRNWRWPPVIPWRTNAAWLAAVLLSTVAVEQCSMVFENRCDWFAEDLGLAKALDCIQTTEEAGGVSFLTAEYIERLLKEDYAGADEGLVEIVPPKFGPKQDQVYLPAGDYGTLGEMGGGDLANEMDALPLADENLMDGREGNDEDSMPLFSKRNDSSKRVDPGSETARDDSASETRPSEDRQGWGLPDWYDDFDRLLDDAEIETMLSVAMRRLKIDPDDAEALTLLGYYQYLGEKWKAALVTYDRFTELYPDAAAGYNNKGLVYKRMKDYGREEVLYRIALSLEPGDTAALNNLAVNLSHQGRFKEALGIMAQLEIIDPNDPYSDLHRAKIYAEMGDNDRAYEYLNQALNGMKSLDTLHHIEFRQDIRLDSSFNQLRNTREFQVLLLKYYGGEE